jgi:hypothetical protein
MLVNLDLSVNNFTGAISERIFSVTSLQTLYLHENTFNGTLSAAVGNLSALRVLSIYDNALVSTLPTALGSITTLEELYAHGNSFSGTIPAALGEQWINMTALSVDGNEALTGDMPASICQLEIPQLFADCERVDCPCCTYCCAQAAAETASFEDVCQPRPSTLNQTGLNIPRRNGTIGLVNLPS